MTPSDITKQLTLLLAEALAPEGFRKKRIGWLLREIGPCGEYVVVSVTRRRGPPGDLYDIAVYLHLNYPAVNKLRGEFLIQHGTFVGSTAVLPLNALTGKSFWAYTWCAAEPLEPVAEAIASDAAAYGPAFWGRYDTLEKLAAHFGDPNGAQVEHGCFFSGLKYEREACRAAVLCLLEDWDALRALLAGPDLHAETAVRVRGWLERHRPDSLL